VEKQICWKCAVGGALAVQVFLHAMNLNFKTQNYFIKQGYISRVSYHHHDDREADDGCQNEVYLCAYDLARQHNLIHITDIGCGSGFKLRAYTKIK
jgi:hypothetical protein